QLLLQDGERLLSNRLFGDDSTEYLSQLRFKDGRVYRRFVSPQRVGGAIVGRVISFSDVTETIQHAQSLDQHRTFLEQAQQVAHVGSWVADLDASDRLGWSAETHRIFGVVPGEFAGTSAAFFGFVHDNDREAVRAATVAATSA